MTDRIRFIDALRGFSLGGIAMVHFGEQYLGFMPPPAHQSYAIWRAVADGRVLEVARVQATTGFRGKWEFQFGPLGRGYQTFGLFLLGLWAGRRRVFEDESHRALFVRLWRWTGALSLLVPLVGLLFAIGQAAGGGGQSQQQPPGTIPDFSSWPLIAGLCAFDGWNNAMTLFYVASFALLFLRPRWQPLLLGFGPVGQTALSAYVGQTVIGVLIFFGIGLGLLGQFGNSVTIPLGLALFVLQMWAARAWLRRFRFGPLEWVWRSLTWLRWEPFRAQAGVAAN